MNRAQRFVLILQAMVARTIRSYVSVESKSSNVAGLLARHCGRASCTHTAVANEANGKRKN